MAKALKPGDAVTVARNYRFKATSDEFQRGLKSLKPGDVGRVLDTAKGRSVKVEFKGHEAVIASQRLERMGEPARKPGRPKKAIQGKQPGGKDGLGSLDNSHFITNVANRLLQSGSGSSIEPNTVVEIQMDDLPKELQAQIQKLVQAKLALGPQTTARKPGRPPKQVENSVAAESTQAGGEAPRRPGRPKGSGKQAK